MNAWLRARNRALKRWTAMTLGTAVCVTAAALPAAAAEPDTEAPRLVDLWVSHEVIDLVDGPAEVTVRAELEDLGSGLSRVLVDPRPGSTYFVDPVEGKDMVLVCGDNHRGVYEGTSIFPEGVEDG